MIRNIVVVGAYSHALILEMLTLRNELQTGVCDESQGEELFLTVIGERQVKRAKYHGVVYATERDFFVRHRNEFDVVFYDTCIEKARFADLIHCADMILVTGGEEVGETVMKVKELVLGELGPKSSPQSCEVIGVNQHSLPGNGYLLAQVWRNEEKPFPLPGYLIKGWERQIKNREIVSVK